MVKLISAATWRQPTDEFIPVGPLKIGIKLAEDMTGKIPKLLVSGQSISTEIEDGLAIYTIPSVTGHKVVVVT